ncbi:MAG: 50S ribosomal protein L9 [Candidatus Cloacimonadaceae bacterium]
MKVILIENIEKVGAKGDVVNVKRGFARNYLVPRDLAIYATPQNLKRLEGMKKQFADEESKRIEQFKQVAASMAGLKLEFVRKVDEHDSMYGSVSETDILHELKEKNIDIPKAAILMEKHIKQLGDFEIPVRLHKEVNLNLLIKVSKEQTEKDKTEKEAVVETQEAVNPAEPEIEEVLETEQIEEPLSEDKE